jgi:outer membrane protein OmpA-like peptidoglycan-associated protein
MSSTHSLALVVCLSLAGCAQSPTTDKTAEDGNWWSFGTDKNASAAASAPKATADKPAQDGNWWSLGADKNTSATASTPKATAQPKPAVASSEHHWWWPFDAKKTPAAPVRMPPPEVTQAWLDTYEPLMREAIKGSSFELERRKNVLVVTAPVDGAFNPDRPSMLLPVTLGPFSRIAKMAEGDKEMSVFILGHADSTGAQEGNRQLSHDRARAVTAIFRLSGLKSNRLRILGLGSDMPRAANDSAEGRALNRRVEILLTAPGTMRALITHYSRPVTVARVVAADQAK